MAEPLRLEGAGVVVTGAASGIGLGLARRFVAEGARVVMCDRDAEALAAAAGAIDATDVHTVVSDLGRPEGTDRLVSRSRALLGAVDLFCANAGVAPAGGVEGSETATAEAWQAAWDVNVMSHVQAAQALLPGWLERGRGHLLVTASAAGLLTMLGSAPYTVSKHAAIGFAEWMRATYDHRGVTVQALCPQGVRTPMLEGSGPVGRLLLEPGSLTVEDVAQTVVEALGDGRFLVLPHPEVAGYVRDKAADPAAWLAAMSRLQRRLDAT